MSRTAARTTARAAALAVSLAVAGSSAVASADVAGATTGYLTVASPSLNERSAPSTSAALVGSLAYHSTIYIACQTSGSLVGRSTVWDKLTNGHYISDYWTNTPGMNTWTTTIPRCTATPPPTVKVGKTVSYNEGAAGQCTWWAITKFQAFSGYFPNLVVAGNDGDAQYWASNASKNGWTVSATPRVDSIVVFPPNVDGATSDGHVAWVTQVSGGQITFTEMNGPAGPYHIDTRAVTPAASVRYIYAP